MLIYRINYMRIIKNNKELTAFLKRLRLRGAGDSRSVEDAVKNILEDVRANGDRAVLNYTRRFDAAGAGRLRLTPAEISRHADKAEPGVVSALETSAKRIRRFHEMQ